MATPISQLKATAAELAARVVGAGLLVWNETAKRWHGGDGVTAGGIPMARLDERNDGALGYLQEIKTAANNPVAVTDSGKVLIGNRATPIAFPLDTAANLGAGFIVIFKNIGAGTMTVAPNGADMIDGVAAAIIVASGSSVLLKGDGLGFRTFLSNSDVTASAIGSAPALLGANLADNDKIAAFDVSANGGAGALVTVVLTELIAGIFKATRSIANVAVQASTFRAKNVGGFSPILDVTALTTDRTITFPNADVKLEKIVGTTVTATPSGVALVDFGSIPADCTQIDVAIAGISTNGASSPSIQLGTSSGIEATGYLGVGMNYGAAAIGSAQLSTAFVLSSPGNAATTHHGIATLKRVGSTNAWAFEGLIAQGAGINGAITVGSKTLSGVLDRLRFTTINQTDLFDAGTVSVTYK